MDRIVVRISVTDGDGIVSGTINLLDNQIEDHVAFAKVRQVNAWSLLLAGIAGPLEDAMYRAWKHGDD